MCLTTFGRRRVWTVDEFHTFSAEPLGHDDRWLRLVDGEGHQSHRGDGPWINTARSTPLAYSRQVHVCHGQQWKSESSVVYTLNREMGTESNAVHGMLHIPSMHSRGSRIEGKRARSPARYGSRSTPKSKPRPRTHTHTRPTSSPFEFWASTMAVAVAMTALTDGLTTIRTYEMPSRVVWTMSRPLAGRMEKTKHRLNTSLRLLDLPQSAFWR